MNSRISACAAMLAFAVLLAPGPSCKSGEAGSFQCINDGDCPPACSCDADFAAVGICERSGIDCGGSCDAESGCPPEQTCRLDRTEGDVEYYACKGGDLGATCTSNNGCDPQASNLGAFCCLDAANCAADLNQCVEDCSTFSSGGQVGEFEGADCENNSECGAGLFCCLVPDAAGNCDFDLDQSCTCRSNMM